MSFVGEGSPEQKFWRSWPLEGWNEPFNSTLQEIDSGTNIVLVSGMVATGKTMQYGARLYEELGLERAEDISAVALSGRNLTQYAGKVFIMDDFADLYSTPDNPESARPLIQDSLANNIQVVAVFSGLNKLQRMGQKYMFSLLARDVAPEARIADMGDFPTSPVDPIKSADLVRHLGCDNEVADMISAYPSLRNPKLFSGILHEIFVASTDIRDRTWLLRALEGVIIGKAAPGSRALAEALYLPYRDSPNLPLVTPKCLTIDEVKELYALVDRDLPPKDELGGFEEVAIKSAGFDPYTKS